MNLKKKEERRKREEKKWVLRKQKKACSVERVDAHVFKSRFRNVYTEFERVLNGCYTSLLLKGLKLLSFSVKGVNDDSNLPCHPRSVAFGRVHCMAIPKRVVWIILF